MGTQRRPDSNPHSGQAQDPSIGRDRLATPMQTTTGDSADYRGMRSAWRDFDRALEYWTMTMMDGEATQSTNVTTWQECIRGKKPLSWTRRRTQPHSTGYNRGMALKIPCRVAANGLRSPRGAAWLQRLPEILGSVERRWSPTVGAPFDNEELSCAWLTPVALADGTSGVVKLGMPHMVAWFRMPLQP